MAPPARPPTTRIFSTGSKIFLGKAWPALDIHVPGCDPQLQDLVVAELDDFQPTAIQQDEDEQKLRAFFTSGTARDAAARSLGSAFGNHLFTEPIEIDDEDWAARSQAGLPPVTVGRITVVPEIGDGFRLQASGFGPDTHDSATGQKSKARSLKPTCFSIIIRPSMGFGTGHHATTRLMLNALQTINVRGRDVIDIGCGSGVLAIASIALGARSAVGIDIDPDALQSAAENVALNGVDDRVTLQQADFRETAAAASVVLANLTGGMVERYAEPLAGTVKPDGYLIISGFMETE